MIATFTLTQPEIETLIKDHISKKFRCDVTSNMWRTHTEDDIVKVQVDVKVIMGNSGPVFRDEK